MDNDRTDETILAITRVNDLIDHWWWGKCSGTLRNKIAYYYGNRPYSLEFQVIGLDEPAPRMSLLKHIQERKVNMEKFIALSADKILEDLHDRGVDTVRPQEG